MAIQTTASTEPPFQGQPWIMQSQGMLLLVAALIMFVAGYSRTLLELVSTWNREPDYSHGFLVIPLAALFLWHRRGSMPALPSRPLWWGLVLVGLACGLRLIAAYYFMTPLDGWSLPIWIAGVVALVGGWPLLRWSAPAIGFLWFMVPLPWRFESILSLRLQGLATTISCWMLQFLGQPAIAEGNTIHLDDHVLEVAQACSGLRMFMAIVALAYVYMVLVRRPWWQKALLFCSLVPIAIVANSLRIVLTGLLYRWVSGEAARAFSHDFAGWVMMPLAAIFFGAALLYLDRLFVEVVPIAQRELLGRKRFR